MKAARSSGDVLDRGEQAALLGELVDQPPLAGIDAADRGRAVVGQLLVAGQVVGIGPDHAAHRQQPEDHSHQQETEDAAEERQERPEHR